MADPAELPADQPADEDGERIAAAVALAGRLLEAALAGTTARRRGGPAGSDGCWTMTTDERCCSPSPTRCCAPRTPRVPCASCVTWWARGTPGALPPSDRLALQLAAAGSRFAPRPVAAVVRRRIRAETRGVIVPAADPAFARYVGRRRRAGFDLNVNLLGEAILGDDEAAARLDAVCARIRRPDVDYVSVKISALCAGLDVLAHDAEVSRIAERLRTLYDVAAARTPAVFVNLDMEEYRDLHLTVDAFTTVSPNRATTACGRASCCRPTSPTPTTSSTGSSPGWAIVIDTAGHP
jgi:RHH-type proline utilization regulon transcriptional repressor/proline dehydrogenase/delta 1-pyrroline-5-carboxylate dehydrogenase